jgi:hypothetical protein
MSEFQKDSEDVSAKKIKLLNKFSCNLWSKTVRSTLTSSSPIRVKDYHNLALSEKSHLITQYCSTVFACIHGVYIYCTHKEYEENLEGKTKCRLHRKSSKECRSHSRLHTQVLADSSVFLIYLSTLEAAGIDGHLDPPIVNYRFPIVSNKLPIADFRLPPSSDFRLSIVANKKKVVDYVSSGTSVILMVLSLISCPSCPVVVVLL